jgi:hypothetical protein
MKRQKRDAILLELIDKLERRGSWCGETHIQKATFFLQEMLRVPMDFGFILYKHGPFSFELRDELTAMRADNYITAKISLWTFLCFRTECRYAASQVSQNSRTLQAASRICG